MSERGWEVHEFTAEELVELRATIDRLKAKHPAPCELFLTTTGRCTCEQ